MFQRFIRLANETSAERALPNDSRPLVSAHRQRAITEVIARHAVLESANSKIIANRRGSTGRN
jgi:hypothetical protein